MPLLSQLRSGASTEIAMDSLKGLHVDQWIAHLNAPGLQARVESSPGDPADHALAESMLLKLATVLREGGLSPAKNEVETAVRPAPAVITRLPGAVGSVPSHLPESRGLTLDEVLKHLMETRSGVLAGKTMLEYQNLVPRFRDWAGQQGIRHIHEIDGPLVARYRAVQRGAISPKTWNKHCSVLSALFKAAQQLGAYPRGDLPTRGLIYSERQLARSTHSWKPFDPAELKAVFDPQAYLKLAMPHQYWTPLLCLHLGLRIGEASQIRAEDFDFSATPPQVTISDEHALQRLKSAAARRTLPIHPRLIELGLQRYVDAVAQLGGDGFIFPYLTPHPQNGLGDLPSQGFLAYLTRRIPDRAQRLLATHSLRKNANDALKQAGVGEETRCQFLGHEHDTINSRVYSQPHSVSRLAELVLPHLSFDIDYQGLGRDQVLLVERIERELRKKDRRASAKVRADRAA